MVSRGHLLEDFNMATLSMWLGSKEKQPTWKDVFTHGDTIGYVLTGLNWPVTHCNVSQVLDIPVPNWTPLDWPVYCFL